MKIKILVVIEVLLVRSAMIGVLWLMLPLNDWQQRVLGFNLLQKVVWLFFPILWLLVTGRKLADFGIHFHDLRGNLTAAMSTFLPVALASASLGFVQYNRWDGALIEVFCFSLALVFVARALTRKPDPNSGVVTILLCCLLFGGYTWWKGMFPGIFQGGLNFINYLVFVGFAEEIWYRGYIQTRLNQVFERRWIFHGVKWGWGVILASLIFGLTHVLNGWNLQTGEFQPLWWWGVWTTVSGLVFGYVREKTGSVVPGAILHGLPQALVYLFMRSF